MKHFYLTLISWFVISPAFAVSGDNFEYHGYMRSGVATNLKGGDSQTCYRQASVPGNEFRLGNECSIYGENLFRIYTPEAKKEGGEFYRGNFGFSYNPAGRTQGELPNFYVYSAYIEAGRLSGGNEVVWVGKRFYRDGDLHIDDFFYFADTSGSGAGIEQIPAFSGNYSLALMFEDSAKLNPSRVDLSTGAILPATPVTTDIGRPRTLLLDNRLFDVKLSIKDRMNFWLGLATSTGGFDALNQVNYSNSSGVVAGIKYAHEIEQGYNRFSVIYGSGLMQGMNLGGSFGTDPTQANNQPYDQSAHRVRIVEDLLWQPSRHFAVAAGAVYESWSLGAKLGNQGRWMSLGTRPIWFFNEHYSVAFEAGASNVRQANQDSSKPLYRVTLAPQISPKPEFYARPVLRAYLTRSFVQGASTSFASTESSFGFQGEIWF